MSTFTVHNAPAGNVRRPKGDYTVAAWDRTARIVRRVYRGLRRDGLTPPQARGAILDCINAFGDRP